MSNLENPRETALPHVELEAVAQEYLAWLNKNVFTESHIKFDGEMFWKQAHQEKRAQHKNNELFWPIVILEILKALDQEQKIILQSSLPEKTKQEALLHLGRYENHTRKIRNLRTYFQNQYQSDLFADQNATSFQEMIRDNQDMATLAKEIKISTLADLERQETFWNIETQSVRSFLTQKIKSLNEILEQIGATTGEALN